MGAPAWAHPFGDQAAAHRLEATVGPEGVRAVWSIDVPNAVILAGAKSPEDGFRRIEVELASGLVIRADGADLELRRSRGEPHRSDEQSWVFPVHVEASWPEVPETLTFENGNLVELRGFFRADVEIASGVAVGSSSLVPLDERGEPIVDHSGRWREGDEHRRVTLDLVRAWSPTTGTTRPVAEALVRPRDERWLWGAGLVVLGLLVLTLRWGSSGRAR